MRILCLASNPDLPEAHLYRGIARAGHEVAVVCEPQARHKDLLASGGVQTFPLVFRSRLDLRAISTVRRLLRERRPQLLHAFTGRAVSTAVLATLAQRVPIVAYRGTLGNVSRMDPAAWLSFLNPKVRRIVCVSQAVRRDLLRVRPEPDVVQTIYKGHDLAWYRSVQPVPRAELGLRDESFVVVCTANMRPLKGVDVLIKAFHRLPPHLDIDLLLVGEVRDRRLPELACSGPLAQRIHFTGFRGDATGITAASNVMVMPTLRREGLPKAVIEAMACEVPAIVSDVGGMPELVEHDRCGLVVPAANDEALSNAILRLYHDRELCSRFGAAARRRIAEHFNIERTIAQTLDLYQSLL